MNVYQCTGRKANKPFYLKKICLRIYSAEELAYAISENPELIEKDIFTFELANWLEEECSAIDLAEKIYRLIASATSLSGTVSAILEYFDFISEYEKDKIVQIIKSGANVNMVEKRKLRGDFFLGKERFGHAIQEYTGLLDSIPPTETAALAEIHDRIGTAQARLFLFEQAEEHFKTAYELDKKKEHYLSYAACLRFRLKESDYIKMAADDVILAEVTLELEQNMQAAITSWKESPEAKEFLLKKTEGQVNESGEYQRYILENLIELKEEYHKFVI